MGERFTLEYSSSSLVLHAPKIHPPAYHHVGSALVQVITKHGGTQEFPGRWLSRDGKLQRQKSDCSTTSRCRAGPGCIATAFLVPSV